METGSKPGIADAGSRIADARGARECLQWFTREKQWINEQHLALLPHPGAYVPRAEAAEWMRTSFAALGCPAEDRSRRERAGAAGPG